MRRSASFLAVLMFSGVVTTLLASSPFAEAGGGNCQEKLVGKSYGCTLESSISSTPLTKCFEFLTGGTSSDFVLEVDGADSVCVCDATGSFKSPAFDSSSSSFECVDGVGVQHNGKVKSDKLSGQISDTDGESLVYTCKENAAPCK
jgi:hypothetical protein